MGQGNSECLCVLSCPIVVQLGPQAPCRKLPGNFQEAAPAAASAACHGLGVGHCASHLSPWPTSGAVPPCKACRQPLVPGLVWAGWHEASPLNRATLAVFGQGGGGAKCPLGRAKGVALVPLPPLATPGWATGNGGQRVWLGVALGVFSLNSA